MKIYFHCSLLGKEKHLEEYEILIKILKEFNHEVFSDHIFKNKYEPFSKKDRRKIYKEIQDKKRLIKLCDAVVVESTHSSIGVGYIISYALEQHKNVLALYQKSPHAVLLGEINRLLVLKEYDIRKENVLRHDLKYFLEKTQEKILKYRFNMMIDQSLNDFLGRESSKLHISKADYVRQLLFEKSIQDKRD